jgi:hypothetical protein
MIANLSHTVRWTLLILLVTATGTSAAVNISGGTLHVRASVMNYGSTNSNTPADKSYTASSTKHSTSTAVFSPVSGFTTNSDISATLSRNPAGTAIDLASVGTVSANVGGNSYCESESSGTFDFTVSTLQTYSAALDVSYYGHATVTLKNSLNTNILSLNDLSGPSSAFLTLSPGTYHGIWDFIVSPRTGTGGTGDMGFHLTQTPEPTSLVALICLGLLPRRRRRSPLSRSTAIA